MVGTKTRFEVFKRDSFTCMYCGRTPPTVTLEVDHIHPTSKGGSDEIDNLITACWDCNSGKSDRLLTESPVAGINLAEKLTFQRERASQLKAYNDFKLSERQEFEGLAMLVSDRWVELEGGDSAETMVELEKMTSIRKFVELLPVAEVLDAVEIAFSKTMHRSYQATWKYFCGICWNKVKMAKGEGA